jgi:hypothetical protein
MRIYLKIITLIACFISCESIFAQSAQQALDQGKDVNVLFRNEATGGIYMHSRGFGAIYRRYWHVTGKLKRLIEFEGLNMRHPKQIATKVDGGGKSYIYGKENALLFIRGGFGFQRTLYERADRKSIEVRMLYSAGVTICFSKPVFLQVDTSVAGQPTVSDVPYTTNINQNIIVGRANVFEGISDMKVYPGVYGKLGFSFEYGDKSNAIKAFEVGSVIDCFPSAIATMAPPVKAENFFVTLYVAFHFGKRWF